MIVGALVEYLFEFNDADIEVQELHHVNRHTIVLLVLGLHHFLLHQLHLGQILDALHYVIGSARARPNQTVDSLVTIFKPVLVDVGEYKVNATGLVSTRDGATQQIH